MEKTVGFDVPFYRGHINVEIPEKNFAGAYHSKVQEYHPEFSEDELVEQALDNPVGSEPLEVLSKGKQLVVVITSDHTRPVPSRVIMPHILRRVRQGNPDADIKILVATGFHRPSTEQELIDKLGSEIVANEEIVMHFSKKDEDMVALGTLPSGGDLLLNKLAVEADLLIAEGFIEPHFFAGFSGGRKSVLPGVASATTVLANHCSEFIQSPYARTGVLDNNPLHRDMVFAADQAKLAFIVNVVINADKKIIHAVTGAHEVAHRSGCAFLSGLCRVPSSGADIVITSNGGSPLDQNIYQAVKGMTAAEASCSQDGVIIMVAACDDGHGGESFYRNMAEASSPAEVLAKVAKIPRNKTIPDQWEFQILARILDKHRVILVTDKCDPEMIKAMHIDHAYTFEEALKAALTDKGSDAKIAVIPDGVSVIVEQSNS